MTKTMTYNEVLNAPDNTLFKRPSDYSPILLKCGNRLWWFEYFQLNSYSKLEIAQKCWASYPSFEVVEGYKVTNFNTSTSARHGDETASVVIKQTVPTKVIELNDSYKATVSQHRVNIAGPDFDGSIPVERITKLKNAIKLLQNETKLDVSNILILATNMQEKIFALLAMSRLSGKPISEVSWADATKSDIDAGEFPYVGTRDRDKVMCFSKAEGEVITVDKIHTLFSRNKHSDRIEVPITPNYVAVVFKDKVVIGCQTFDAGVVDELSRAIESLTHD